MGNARLLRDSLGNSEFVPVPVDRHRHAKKQMELIILSSLSVSANSHIKIVSKPFQRKQYIFSIKNYSNGSRTVQASSKLLTKFSCFLIGQQNH